MENYSVYIHIFPNGKKYIGITKQKPKRRWQNGKAYKHNPYITSAINKYGWDNIEHMILYNNLSKEQAEQKEIELIKKYQSANRKYGYNISNGGNTIGTHSEETKKKLSEIHTGKEGLKGERNPMYGKKGIKHPNYGKHLSEDIKKKISKKLKGKPRTDHDEFIIKQSIRVAGDKNPRARKILQFKTDGQLVKEWTCSKYASKYYGLSNGNIINVCKGRQKTARGYIWKYAEEE